MRSARATGEVPVFQLPGAGLDSAVGEGDRIWGQVQLALPRRLPMEHAVAEHRYGKPILVQPRLGQGAFRLLVTDAYQRRLIAPAPVAAGAASVGRVPRVA